MSGGQHQDDNDLSVSLAERIVQRIPLSLDAFQDKLGINLDYCETTDSQIPPFRGNWQKLRKAHQKHQLHASLRYWIDKLGKAKCLLPGQTNISNQVLYEAYLQKAQQDLELIRYSALRHNWSSDTRGFLVETQSPSTLHVYHHGILLHGNAVYTPKSRKADTTPFYQTVSNLYDQLWWFRTVQGLAVTQSLGFCVHLTDQDVTISLMILEMPSIVGLGERYSLYEYTQSYSTTASLNGKVIFRNLGVFLLQASSLHNPFLSAEHLEEHSPGFMLMNLPVTETSKTLHCFEVVPTMTGSLVLRCQDLVAIEELVCHGQNTSQDLATTVWYEDIQAALHNTEETQDKCDWYIKVKTPVFGQFWDTATVAINGTRNLLRARMDKMSEEEQNVAFHWLRMHPVNSLIESHRTITVVRGVGVPYCGQLALQDFKKEFLSLAERILCFQAMSRLVHGDIHEGNILISQSFCLNLIDWDEALRLHPCRRSISTDEDRRRYPNDLVDFPELYTKYQLLSVFHHYWSRYYKSMDDSMLKDNQKDWHTWVETSATAPGQPLRLRDTVVAKFKGLCKCLTHSCCD